MAIPTGGGAMAELLATYHHPWVEAGHPGRGKVMLAFHMLCHEDQAQAVQIACHWLSGVHSADYPGYAQIIAALERETFETQVDSGAAWVGDPDTIRKAITTYYDRVGGFEIAPLQINFYTITQQEAEQSMRLFAQEVMPHFTPQQ